MTDLLRDDSLSLLTRGYGFGARIWQRVHTGARSAPMRLLGREALFVRGAEGVSLFYDESRIRRHGAMPAFVQETLFGHGSVHSLDGDEHRHRKSTFLDVAYEDAQVERLTPHLEREWQAELDAWADGTSQRSAYDAAVGALGRAIMRWAGLPGTTAAKTRWAERLAQVVDGFGTPYSPSFLMAVLNRGWSDRHAMHLIEAVRAGELEATEGTALHEWAWHRGEDGALLSPRLAGIELQNVLRPTIAVARFVAFAAKELHDRPEWRARIAVETEERGALVGGPLATAFAQEIRRTAPFVPMLPGWAITDIELDGEQVSAGGRVVLDILGTDTDARSWRHPEKFDPERFVGLDDYEALRVFIPHGGGDVATGHRCPGEKLAIAGLAAAVAAMSDPRVTILDDGLDVNERRLPTKPRSGGRVRAAGATGESRCPFH
ncbi:MULTISPECIES: cytochrome P450 [unclassified Microbacterium]|uniref:cytochrome P450 n=1 Tax=unclassified Microbacterium TaxID=2609290 RepID=UPI000EA98580|nr:MULTISPECIES: cytochrome P450 [unclassified Microbacterium]MBT2483843.1 cytochrome P450 [Microbacterium sp. ISL-108]RKN66825.1 cytochrome P450 [Microbacterium sp. CGR2]